MFLALGLGIPQGHGGREVRPTDQNSEEGTVGEWGRGGRMGPGWGGVEEG